jgi:hypothetical protein
MRKPAHPDSSTRRARVHTPTILAVAVAITSTFVADAAIATEPPTTPPPATGEVVIDLRNLPSAPAQEVIKPSEDAASLFMMRCAQCHGPTGRGDGPTARALNPRPRDFSKPSWHVAVDDESIKKAIQLGGTAIGRSALMPPHPDLKGGLLDGVVLLLRSFKRASVPSVFLELETAKDSAGAHTVIAKKRVRLTGATLRARFKNVPPGASRVVGFVDLDGDGEPLADSEVSFVTPLKAVTAGGTTSHDVTLKPPAPKSPPAPVPPKAAE